MFYNEGEEKEALDVIQFVWTGSWPENDAPKIVRLFLDGKSKNQNTELKQGQRLNVTIFAHDPNKDILMLEWEIYPENTEFEYAVPGNNHPTASHY